MNKYQQTKERQKRERKENAKKAGVFDPLQNKIFIKNGVQYVFDYMQYENGTFSFFFNPTNQNSNVYMIIVYNRHHAEYVDIWGNAWGVVLSQFDEIKEA